MLFRGVEHFGGWSISNALNLEKFGVKIHNSALLLDFFGPFSLFHMDAHKISQISPVNQKRKWYIFLCGSPLHRDKYKNYVTILEAYLNI